MTRSRFADSFLSALVRLYPEPYRGRFGREMLQVWRLDGEEARRRGLLAACAYWSKLVAVSVADAAGRRLRTDPSEPVPPPEPRGSLGRELLSHDLRHSLRRLLRRPGWTATAVLTLGLGLGATVTVFSLVNDVMLRPLGFANEEELVRLRYSNVETQRPYGATSVPGWRVFQEQPLGLAGLEVFSDWVFNVDTRPPASKGAGGSGRWSGSLSRRTIGVASAGFFDLLGVAPQLGQGFERQHDEKGSEPVALLSHGLWRDDYGLDPAAVGSTVTIGEVPHRILGVLPERYDFGVTGAGLWVPLGGMPHDRDWFYLAMVGRVEDGALLSQVQARLRSMELDFPDGSEGNFLRVRPEVVPLQADQVGELGQALVLLLGAVVVVLLVSCLNVANLILGRAVGRRRELALRAALGAGRGRLMIETAVESLVLGLLGGAVGLGVAQLLIALLRRLGTLWMPRPAELGLDPEALLFALGVSLLVGLVVGVLPAFGITGRDPARLLGSGRVVSGGRRTRSALVVGQIAGAVVLVMAALLLLDSLRAITRGERGFEREGTVVLGIALPEVRYDTLDVQRDYYGRLLEELRSLPGVTATVASSHPFAFYTGNNFEIRGVELDGTLSARVRHVADQYLETVGTRIVAGRKFHSGERGVVYVNETMAERYFPNGEAVGREIRLGALNDPDRTWRTIVGVVETVRHFRQSADPSPAVLVPYEDLDWAWVMTPLLRVDGDLAALAPALRERVLAVDPKVPLGRIDPFGAILSRGRSEPLLRTTLLSLFGVVALVLSAVGLYGVVAHWVAERRREMGVRMALGAGRSQVVGLVLGHSFSLTAAGVVLGLLLALPATQLLQTWLVDVGAFEPARHATAVGLLLAAALLAAWIPARRAASVAPAESLRAE